MTLALPAIPPTLIIAQLAPKDPTSKKFSKINFIAFNVIYLIYLPNVLIVKFLLNALNVNLDIN